MTFTIASWNVNGRKSAVRHCEFIRKTQPHLLALQEVTLSFFQSIMGSPMFEWGIHSITLRPSLRSEGRRRGLGTALLGRAPFFFKDAALLSSVPAPERALITDVDSPEGVIKVCAFHVPPGATWGGPMKSQTFRGFAEWLREQSGPVLVGMDANTPKLDHPTHSLNEWWRKDEDLLLGATATHGLSDALRTHLSANGEISKRTIEERPQGHWRCRLLEKETASQPLVGMILFWRRIISISIRWRIRMRIQFGQAVTIRW
jgi:exonuclease III